MQKKKWYVTFFYLMFIMIYALALSIPIGIAVKADDTAPADPPTEETTAEDPPPEEPPPAESPGEPAPAPVVVEPAPAAPPPVVVVEPPPVVVVEQPQAAEVQPSAGAEQPVVTDVQPPAAEEPPAATDVQPPVEGGQPLAPDAIEAPATDVQLPAAEVQPAASAGDEQPAPVQPAASNPAPDVAAGNEPATTTVETVASPVEAGAAVAPEAVVDPIAPESLATPVEVLDALPEGANLVILDQVGAALPLASSEAADTLANGDPMYCAGTDAPGSPSCHSYGTIESAVNHAKVPGNGNCTIYVEVGYTSPNNNTIVIDGLDFDVNSNINLFGGYNLTNGTVVGQTALVQNFLISNITGSLTLANFLIQEFSTIGNTIEVNDSEDVTLKNLDINNSGNGNAIRINHSDNVAIKNSKIQDKTNGVGVYLHFSDNSQIVDTSIKEYGNDGGVFVEYSNGVLLQNVNIQSHDSGCTIGGCYMDAIRVNYGSNYTLQNVSGTSDYGSGLSTNNGVTGYVRIFNSEFDDNGQRGVSVFSGGPVSITNTSVSDNQGDYGLVVQSGTIDLNTVHVDSNQNRGAYLFATDWINLQTSTFSGNHHYYGLYATSANQYINVNGITANGNDNYGATLVANTYINVFNSNFIANGYYGLWATAPDSISLFNVNSSINEDDGVVLNSQGPITVTCSVFSQNGQDGLESSMSGSGASLTLNSVTISGNGQARDISGGPVFENLNYPCGSSSSSDTDDTGTTSTTTTAPAVVFVIAPLGTEMIPVTGGQFVDLSCTGGSTLRLPDGEETIFNQVMCGYKASMDKVTIENLPAPVPQPWVFTDGFTVTLMFGQDVVIDAFPGATYEVLFPIAGDQSDVTFHILFWDVTADNGLGAWVDLGGIKEAQMWVKTYNKTGTFVLVK